MFDLPSYLMGSRSSGSGSGGSSTLVGLTDVDISNPTDGQKLVYDAITGKWKNDNCNCNDMLVVRMTDTGTALVLDKTWKEIYDSSLPILLDVYEEDGYISRGFNPLFLAEHENETYTISICILNFYSDSDDVALDKYVFTTNNENGYPVRQNSN